VPGGWVWKPPHNFKDLCSPTGFVSNWLRDDLPTCEGHRGKGWEEAELDFSSIGFLTRFSDLSPGCSSGV